MKIRILGAHNAETRDTRLPALLIDDRLALDAGSLASSLSLEQQLKLSAILLTHQHLDHIRDIPMIAMNCHLNNASVRVYGTAGVRQALADHILNGQIYSRFFEQQALDFHVIEPYQPFVIGEYEVMAIPVNHSAPTSGFRVTCSGKSLFYTGDTGPGLEECWKHVTPDILVIEVTASNRWTDFGRQSLHLTPELLEKELAVFQDMNHYLPGVVAVHMTPSLEADIRTELAQVARKLNADISPACEGMEISC